MKKTVLFFCAACMLQQELGAQVAISNPASAPHASAMLDVKSTTKGFLAPRMTSVQRAAIASPSDGLWVYDTDTKTFWFYKTGTGWTQLTTGGGGLTLPYAATVNNAATLFSLTNDGDGTSLEGTNNTTTSSIAAVRGIVSSTAPGGFSSAVRGINNGTGGLGIGVWGSQAGSGWGMYGVTPTGIGVYGNSSASGYGLYGNSNSGTGLYATSTNGIAANISISNNANANNVLNASTLGAGKVINASTSGTGSVGWFENTNTANIETNIVEVLSNSTGNIPNNKLGNAASFFVNNTGSVGAAVRGEVNSIYGNFGAAGIFGVSSGTGGRAGLFYASNPSGNGASLISLSDGNGNAITANAGKNGNGVETNIDGSGNALYAWVPTFATGRAARFNIYNEDNENEVVTATTVGNGTAGSFKVDRNTGTSPAVKGEVNSIFANFGTAGVYGLSSGTGGFGGLFYASNAGGNGPALLALTEGAGNGITANAGGNGDGVEATCDGTGNAIFGWTPNFGSGRAGRFANYNAANSNPTVHISNVGTGNAFLINHTGPSGNLATFQSEGLNVARINKAGRGFFNGGTQTGGADLAEAFDVTGSTEEYEPGDVLTIATDKDRAVEKSAGAYSSLVIGVYATKPGVLLTEENIDSDLAGKVPMGVVGVIPTKVCTEGGSIKRGDMLVTSSTPGVAMKADADKAKTGQVIGKALQEYSATGIGKINVFVNVK